MNGHCSSTRAIVHSGRPTLDGTRRRTAVDVNQRIKRSPCSDSSLRLRRRATSSEPDSSHEWSRQNSTDHQPTKHTQMPAGEASANEQPISEILRNEVGHKAVERNKTDLEIRLDRVFQQIDLSILADGTAAEPSCRVFHAIDWKSLCIGTASPICHASLSSRYISLAVVPRHCSFGSPQNSVRGAWCVKFNG